MKKSLGLLLMVFCSTLSAEGWLSNQVLTEVGVKYGNGCIVMAGGEVAKLDLDTEAGKAEYSLALAAIASGKTIDIYQTDGALLGGCDNGMSIKPHSMLKIDK